MKRRNFLNFAFCSPMLAAFQIKAGAFPFKPLDDKVDIEREERFEIEKFWSPISPSSTEGKMILENAMRWAKALSEPFYFKGFIGDNVSIPGYELRGVILWRGDIKFLDERWHVFHYVTMSGFNYENLKSQKHIQSRIETAKERAFRLMGHTKEKRVCLDKPFTAINWVKYDSDCLLIGV